MIEAGLCTKNNFQSGKKELLDCIERFFENKSEVVVVEDYGEKQIKKWSNTKDTIDEGSQIEMACKEFDRFELWNDGKYFPQMNTLKLLGAIDDEVHMK